METNPRARLPEERDPPPLPKFNFPQSDSQEDHAEKQANTEEEFDQFIGSVVKHYSTTLSRPVVFSQESNLDSAEKQTSNSTARPTRRWLVLGVIVLGGACVSALVLGGYFLMGKMKSGSSGSPMIGSPEKLKRSPKEARNAPLRIIPSPQAEPLAESKARQNQPIEASTLQSDAAKAQAHPDDSEPAGENQSAGDPKKTVRDAKPVLNKSRLSPKSKRARGKARKHKISPRKKVKNTSRAIEWKDPYQ